MSNQLYSGQGRDINVFAGQSLAVSSITGAYTATIIAGAGIGTALATDSAGGATYGPYSGGVTVRLKSGEGGLIDYEAAVSPVLNYAGPARLGYSAAGDTSSAVDGGGNLVVRLDNTPGADKSITPVQSMESVAAMSTTVTVRMAPTGTYRTARVSWVNNGASGSAKLNIAANCENDVAGIVASQSSLQRDAQMTMGDALLLISPIPITSLNFSSDGSITSDTHRLVVTFGA